MTFLSGHYRFPYYIAGISVLPVTYLHTAHYAIPCRMQTAGNTVHGGETRHIFVKG